jgi:hypothetical protein
MGPGSRAQSVVPNWEGKLIAEFDAHRVYCPAPCYLRFPSHCSSAGPVCIACPSNPSMIQSGWSDPHLDSLFKLVSIVQRQCVNVYLTIIPIPLTLFVTSYSLVKISRLREHLTAHASNNHHASRRMATHVEVQSSHQQSGPNDKSSIPCRS